MSLTEAEGHCFLREDSTHCECWWDGDSPCCACGFTEEDCERVTGKPITYESVSKQQGLSAEEVLARLEREKAAEKAIAAELGFPGLDIPDRRAP